MIIRIKQIIIVIFIISMIIGVLSLFKENIVLLGRNENIKKAVDINDMQIIDTEENSVDTVAEEHSKLSYGIQELLSEQNSNSQKEKVIEVVVYSQFNQSVNDLVAAIEKVFKDVEITVRNFDSCSLFVRVDQLNILNQILEVRRICLKSETEGETDYTTEYTSDHE